MLYQIDINCFEKYYDLFINLVEAKSKTKFTSFPGNRFTQENEGYKDEIYKKAIDKLQYWRWDENNIGTGDILKKVISAIKLEKNLNNLVDWRLTAKFEEQIKNEDDISNYEKALFDFFYGVKTDKDSFNLFIDFFGKNYPLIAYLFFIKDKARYMPISPSHFDTAFTKLGVKNFKTSMQCSWDNYLTYNGLLDQVKNLLINSDVNDVTLLNAHSFVWIISDIEEYLKKNGINAKKTISFINEYQKLQSKDKEAIMRDTDRDNFMSAEEAVDYGLVDKVFDKRKMKLS